MENSILIEYQDTVATVSLNRPHVRNAFDVEMMTALHEVFLQLAKNEEIHVVVLRGEGSVFCAGADLAYMASATQKTDAQNYAESQLMSDMFLALATLPQTTVCVIQGAVYGGGLGLVACCDIVMALNETRFCFSEVKMGLLPAVISPFVLHKIKATDAQRYFLTGDVFGATDAQRIGLIHIVVDELSLADEVNQQIDNLVSLSFDATRACKNLIKEVTAPRYLNKDLRDETCRLIIAQRKTPTAQKLLAERLAKKS